MVLLKKLRKQENKGGKFLAPPVGGRTVVPKLILANQKIRYTIVDVGISSSSFPPLGFKTIKSIKMMPSTPKRKHREQAT